MTQRFVNTARDYRLVNGSGDYRLVDTVSRTPPDMPSTPGPMAARVSSYAPTYVSVTNALTRQVRSRGVQAWRLGLAYGGMKRADFAPLWAFLVKQGGQAGSFTAQLSAFAPRGTAAGTPMVNGGSQTGTSLVTDGWTPGDTVLKAGDFFQLENDKKVYQVTADAVANGSGQVTLSLYPALRKVPADNAEIYTDVLWTVALAEDLLDSDWDQCLIVKGFELNLIEVLS